MSVYITAPNTNDSWLTKLYMRITGSLSFSANRDNVVQSIPDVTLTTVVFTTLDYDTTGGFSTSTGKWTCQQGGIYSFYVKGVLSTTLLATKSFTLSLYKNSTQVDLTEYNCPADVLNPHLVIHKELKLNKGDVIEVKAFQNTGGAVDLYGATHRTYFTGKRVT